jgi:antitoxin VapB
MAINIKNRQVELLVDQVVALTGETKVEAVRRALEERHARLTLRVGQPQRWEQALRFLEREVWPSLPPETLGRRLSRAEEAAMLGYGMRNGSPTTKLGDQM